MTKLLPAHRHFYPLYPISSLILFAVLMLFGGEGRGQTLINETLRSGSLPSGWTETDITFETGAGGYARFTSINSVLTTSAFNASAYSSIEVDLSIAKYGSGGDGPITVEYSLNGLDNWVDASNSSIPESSSPYLNNTIEIAATSSTMVVRFSREDSPSEKRLRDIIITGIGSSGSPDPEPTNHPTNFTATAAGSSRIDLIWTDATGGQMPAGYLIKANTTGTFVDPVDGTDPTQDADLSDGNALVKVAQGGESYSFTGLTASTTYYFKVWPYTNTGADIDFKTDGTVLTAIATTDEAVAVCGNESFNNIPASSNQYLSRTWTGDDGVTWTAEGARTDETINGKAICWGTSGTRNVISPSYPNGVGTLQFSYVRAFTGTNARSLEVYVNNNLQATFSVNPTSDVVQQFSQEIDITGNVVIEIRSTGAAQVKIDDLTWTCYSTPTPTISLSGNGESITNGSTTTTATNHTDFGNVNVASGTQARTFTITNTGTADLVLNGTSNLVAITGAADFRISTQPGISTIAPSGSTTFEITFEPSALGLREATVTILNNDEEFTFAISGNGTNSNLSDIEYNFSSSASTNENIDYAIYQSETITNTGSGTGGSIGVMGFRIRDGGGSNDSDLLPTTLNSITFSATNSANIRSAALFNSSSLIKAVAVNGASTFTFDELSGALVTCNDNQTLALNLRITFQSSVTDNQKMVFKVTEAIADPTGSTFAQSNAGGAYSDILENNDRNRIEVTADRLGFTLQPANSSIGVSLNPFTVSAIDNLNNIDLDYSGNITLTTSGTDFSATNPYSLVNGSVSINNVIYSSAQTNITITASSADLTAAESNQFNISEIVIAENSYRTVSDGTWPTSGSATWQRFNSGFWNSSSAPPANTTNTIYIRHTITTNGAFAAPAPGTSMIVEAGGTFNAGHNCTLSSLVVQDGGYFFINNPSVDISSTGTVTVESGGRVVANSATFNNADGFWEGTENFMDGSIFEIQNWDWNSSPGQERLIDSDNPITTNDDGYYFGNIYFNASPDGKAFTLVGLTGNYKLCQNDLIINNGNSETNRNVILTNVNANIEIGGSVIATRNTFSFGAIGSSNIIHTVGGNLLGNGGNINLNQQSAGSASVTVNINGNLDIQSSSQLLSTDQGCMIRFTSPTNQTLSIQGTLGTNVTFEIAPGSTTQLINQNLDLVNASNRLTVLTGGTLDFNQLNILGAGAFELQAAGNLLITSGDGINASGNNTGNLQNTGTRTFSQSGYFHYTGNSTPQETGTAITSGSTSKRIIVNKTNPDDLVILTQSTGTTDRLEILNGVFRTTSSEIISGSGSLIMSGGTYQIAQLTSTPQYVPQLSGVYAITGGTVELNGVGDQVLRGGREYHSLTFSGGGTKTTSNAIDNINGTVTIKDDNTELDISRTFKGIAGLVMTDNSRFRMSLLNETLPQLEGAYNLTGGTIEWYGTSYTQTHSIRGDRTYNNIDINADDLNDEFDKANVVVGSGFQVNGTLHVNSPASLKIGSSYTISGDGIVNINGDATLKYGSPDGISSSGETGNIQTDTRVFSNTAGYALIGSVDQVTGTGLPTTVSRLNIEKFNPENTVTFTNEVAVTERLHMRRGIVVNPDHELTIGSSVELPGNLDYEEGVIRGKITRWIPASTGSYLFPVGKTTYNPATVQFTSSTNGGTLTAEFIDQIPVGYLGNLPQIFDEITFNNLSEKGFWRIEANNGLSNGTYTLRLDASGFPGVDVPGNIRILKSPSESYTWSIDGTFLSFTDDIIIHSGMSGFSDFALGGDSNENPLPIELLHFTAAINNAEVFLSWATASEINNDFFTLERSVDMQTAEVIGYVQGAGNSNQTLAYQFTDRHPLPGISYYRLKQTDFDGSFEYSNWTAVSQATEKNASLEIVNVIYRNDQTQLWAKVQPGEPLQLQVFDLFGREVYRHEFMPESSAFEHTFPASPKGLYIIRLTDAHTYQTWKFGNP